MFSSIPHSRRGIPRFSPRGFRPPQEISVFTNMAENGFTNLGEEFENKQQNTNETVTEPEVEGIFCLFSFVLISRRLPEGCDSYWWKRNYLFAHFSLVMNRCGWTLHELRWHWSQPFNDDSYSQFPRDHYCCFRMYVLLYSDNMQALSVALRTTRFRAELPFKSVVFVISSLWQIRLLVVSLSSHW